MGSSISIKTPDYGGDAKIYGLKNQDIHRGILPWVPEKKPKGKGTVNGSA
jgi:hypothetical protein